MTQLSSELAVSRPGGRPFPSPHWAAAVEATRRAWLTTSAAETAPAGPLASRTLLVAVPGAHLELDLAPLASVRRLLWLVVTTALGAFVAGRPERRSAGPVHGPGALHRAAP